MKILIVSATTFEISPLLQHLDEHAERLSFFSYKYGENEIYPLVTGVGALNTAFGIARFKDPEHIDVAFNVGLAGAYHSNQELGAVVEVTTDRFADLGVEEKDGSFTDVFDLGLSQKDQFPYDEGWIKNTKPKFNLNLPKVLALTVNKVHGNHESIRRIKSKYTADVESMEGAGFLYACRIMDIHSHQIRAISNYVEPRDKANWKIEIAIDNLNTYLIQLLNPDVEYNTQT